MAVAAKASSAIEVVELDYQTVEITVVGRNPIILNKLAAKARQELLFPSGRKTPADKLAHLKHNPMQEFRDSAHILESEDQPTLLGFPAGGMKKAMSLAALRTSKGQSGGVSKTEFKQLCWVENEFIPIYGTPKLMMSVTRQAGMNATPDIRTRLVVPEWSSTFRVTFIRPNLNEKAISNLIHAAGLVSGIGDWRPEKGSGTFGQFALVDEDNIIAQKIRSEGGREEQIAAMENPEAYDRETQQLLEWWTNELSERGRTAK